ncbi:MAG: hypothetical protein FK734_02910 [Asgard group archaeon]|nr:hypothetical protein [Asgard group archaeon]
MNAIRKIIIIILLIFSLNISFIINNGNLSDNLSNTLGKNIDNDITNYFVTNNIDYSENYTIIDRLDNDFAGLIPNDLKIYGDFAFLVAEDDGMLIFNVSDISNPILVSQYLRYGDAEGIFVNDDLAFLSCGYSGLDIIDISDITKPKLISHFTDNGSIVCCAVQGSYLFYGENYQVGTAGIGVLDISNIYFPKKIFLYIEANLGFVKEMVINDNNLYFTTQNGVMKFDIEDPYHTELLKQLRGYSYIEGSFIDFENNLLYLTSFYYGFIIYDIQDFYNPVELSRLMTGIFPQDCQVIGSTAFIADTNFGLLIVDLTNIEEPVIITNDLIWGNKKDLIVKDNYVMITDDEKLFLVYNCEVLTNPELVYTMKKSGYSSNIIVEENYAFIADGTDGVEICLISDIESLSKETTFLLTNASMVDLTLSGNHMFIADELYGLIIADISTKTSPYYISNITDGGKPKKIELKDDLIFLADYEQGLEIYDVSNVYSPQKLSTTNISGITDIWLEGDFAFVTIQNVGVSILNTTNITQPTFYTNYSIVSDLQGLWKTNDYLYLANGDDGFLQYDISNLLSPSIVSTGLAISQVESIMMNGTRLYLCSKESGVLIYETQSGLITNSLGTIYNGGDTNAIDIIGEFIYIANGCENFELAGLDSDGDHLADFLELYEYFTDPFDADSDDDGINDFYEVYKYSTNPLTSDSDSDSMSDLYEVENGLDPNNASDANLDYDQDGLTNLEECQNQTDPWDDDTDGDYLTDGDEVYIYNTNPLNPDTDGDGWSDSFEIYYETDPLDPDDYPDLASTPPLTASPPPPIVEFPLIYLFPIIGGTIFLAIIIAVLVMRFKPKGIV